MTNNQSSIGINTANPAFNPALQMNANGNPNNYVQLVGRLGAAPELKKSERGKLYARISIAINRQFKNGQSELVKDTTWISVTAWEDMAERMAKELEKGKMVAVYGRLVSRTWEEDGKRRSRLEIVVRDFSPMEPKAKEDAVVLTIH
jgi:single-strand DNA-binding protein